MEKVKINFFLGITFITTAFIFNVSLLYIKDNEDRRAIERISDAQSKFQPKQQENDKIENVLDKRPAMGWIADIETGDVILTWGSLRGSKEGAIYNIYHNKELLGQVKTETVMGYLSFGEILNYNKKDFPENLRSFEVKFD